MSSHFKINTWKVDHIHRTMQIQAGADQLYLDVEDAQKLVDWVDEHREEFDMP
ncbi:MAG: hypothetical protein PHX61_02445 [Alphaproteobacteria bacterium]|nr:hypothetical protein [Alphaproteobacteria bacterium]